MGLYGEEVEEQGPDKRKSQRWNIPVPVHVKVVRSGGKTFEEDTITADVSPTGMCVLLTRKVEKGDHVEIKALEDDFESPASITRVSPLGPNMNRVRVMFPKEKTYSRQSASKKFVYDYESDNWVAYILEGIYYSTKHEPFGKVEENSVVSPDSGAVLFTINGDRVYNAFRVCIGHIV